MYNLFACYLVLFILVYAVPSIAARAAYKSSMVNTIKAAYNYFKIGWKKNKVRTSKIIGIAWCLCFMFYVIELCLWQLVKIKGIENLSIDVLKLHAFLTKNLNTQSIIFLFVCTACLPAIFEEYIFRYVLFEKVFKKSIVGGYIISSIIFAILHLNYSVVISKFLFGLLCCYIVSKTGSIMYTIVLHFINNLVALIISKYLATLNLLGNETRSNVSNIDFSSKVFLFFCIWSFLFFCVVLFKYLKDLLQDNVANTKNLKIKQIED
jgi:membrane protease YdiL (CAAX protease family)